MPWWGDSLPARRPCRSSPGRLAIIRKKLPERPDPQMPLFTLERYSYQVIATNIADMAPEEV